MSKKTIQVEVLRNRINNTMKTDIGPHEGRQSLLCLLEDILHETGNYRGYRYLTEKEVLLNARPGIRTTNLSGNELEYSDKFYCTDSTRVEYY